MKLATIHDGSRDGQLLVVSRDLSQAHYTSGIAMTLRQALDDWCFMAPQLEALFQQLNSGKARHAFPFDPARCMAPLPRGGQWFEAETLCNQQDPSASAAEPVLLAGGGNCIGPCDDLVVSASAGIDFAAHLAVILGDLPQGSGPDAALTSVRLLVLANAVSLANLGPGTEGIAHLRPLTAFSPVAITPDEAGTAWHGGRLHLRLQTQWNSTQVGQYDLGASETADFGQLAALLCRHRPVQAGTMLGISAGGKLGALPDQCIADSGRAATSCMQAGDRVRIEVLSSTGQSLFGAIDQKVYQ